MKNKKKAYIDTYETVYPIHLVVANEHVKLEQLKKEYCFTDDSILDDSILKAVATTCLCKRMSDDRIVTLVKFNHCCSVKGINKQSDLMGTCTHEAIHVVLDTYNYIGAHVSNEEQETFAYQVEWVAQCIYKTLTKK